MTKSPAFTLVELLVVMSIIGVLATLVVGSFRSAQIRGRDVQRKSDIKELVNALELIESDYGLYPPETAGQIAGCPYDPATQTGTPCSWGQDQLTDSKSLYMAKMPVDPKSSLDYYYRVVPGSLNGKFQLFAHLENSEDPDCLGSDCSTAAVPYLCGAEICNFSLTSSNTTPFE